MSGSDAPARGDWSAFADDTTDCAALRLTRYLQGPVPQVVESLVVDDVLHVWLRRVSATEVSASDTAAANVSEPAAPVGPTDEIIATDERERVAGGILPTVGLLKCLREGVEFVGVVQIADGGAVQIEVRAVTCPTLRRLVRIETSGNHEFSLGEVLDVATPLDAGSPIALVADGTQVGVIGPDAALAGCLLEDTQFVAAVVDTTERAVLAVVRARR